jgi:phosphatidate phosphatase LPIN
MNVNDVEADFQMYLDNKGEAFFLREVDADEAILIDPLCDDIADQSLRSKSSNFGSEDGKIVGRTSSNFQAFTNTYILLISFCNFFFIF